MKIITVFKTHVDIGFTDLPQKVIENYAFGMLRDAVETCEATANNPEGEKFIWTLPAFPLYYALNTTSDDIRMRSEKLIASGQIRWHALPFTLRTEFFTKEELCHSLNYAKTLSDKYKKPMPIAAKMTDVPGHTQALVDVLCENGIKFLHLGCNPASTTPKVPTLFWWESSNGNKILTYYNKDYGSSILPPENWKFPVHLALIQTNDNCGVQSPEVIDELKQKSLEAIPGARFVTGTLDDFAEEILKQDLSGLPVIRGELGDSWIHCLGAFPESTAKIREARRIFKNLEQIPNLKSDETIASLKEIYYENGLLFGEHSGGVDTKKYLADRVYEKTALKEKLGSEEYLYADLGWNQEREWADNCIKAACDAQEYAEKAFGLQIGRKQASSENEFWKIYIEGNFLVAYNKNKKEKITIDYLYEIIGKRRMEKYLDDYLTLKVDWSIEDFGRKNYPDIEDEEYGLILSETKITKEVVSAGYSVPEESVREYGNAQKIIITASAEGEKLLISVEIQQKEPTMYIEGGHLVMNFEREFENVIVQKCGLEINPDTDVVKGANRGLFATDEYIKINDMKINPVHTPLVSFGESKIYRFCCGDFKQSKTPKVFFNLFNNMWGTGNPQWITGNYKFDFEIV